MSGVEGLKPCPFCGGVLDVSADDIDGFIGHVECNGCDMRGPISEWKYDDPEEAKADAVSRWCAALSAIEGGGGLKRLVGDGFTDDTEALQQRVTAPAEQADGGVVGWQPIDTHDGSRGSVLVVMAVVTAPIWLFCARLWWSWTHALLTKPWVEIFCIGNGC
jgi:hypothetical protein